MKVRKKIRDILKNEFTGTGSVSLFLYDCVKTLKLGIGFHPDTDFFNYVDENDKPVFSKDEAHLLNESIKKCFKKCKDLGLDIYGITLSAFKINKPEDIKITTMDTKQLLQTALTIVNHIPNQKIPGIEFKNTYEFASALGRHLKYFDDSCCGISRNDIIDTAKDLGLQELTDQQISDVLALCEKYYDFSGNGLHGFELINHCLGELDIKS